MEVEAKYDLNKVEEYKFWSEYWQAGQDIAAWQAVPESRKVLDMLAVYFDTEDCALSENYISLRLRKEGSKLKLNLKQDLAHSGALSERKEWEYDLSKDYAEPLILERFTAELPNLLKAKAAENPDLADFLQPLQEKTFIELGRIDFSRLIIDYQKPMLAADDSMNIAPKLEWSLDHGFFYAGQHSEEFAEMEFELKEGKVSDLQELLKELPKIRAVNAQSLSKRARLQSLCEA